MFKYTQVAVYWICTFSKSNTSVLVPRLLKVLIILLTEPSDRKGRNTVICKNDEPVWILEYKNIALFFINCFQLIIINEKSIRADLPIKMIILYIIFLKKMSYIQTPLACKYETLRRSSKIKVTEPDKVWFFLLVIKEIRCAQKPSLCLGRIIWFINTL